MHTILVTDQPADWHDLQDLVPVVQASDYLSDNTWHQNKSLRVINLCESYNYQSIGYYVSLLAQARDHKVSPSVNSIQDVLNVSLSKLISADIHDEIQHALRHIKHDTFIFSLYFGQNIAKHYATLARKLHGLFPLPLLRFTLEKKKEWDIKSVIPLAFKNIPLAHIAFLQEALQNYLSKKRVYQWRKKQYFHDLAILVDPEESYPPSNKKALETFLRIGEENGFNVDLIDKNYSAKSLTEYDALFIRTTTSVNHYTYRMARRAEQENLVVIDDSESIIKCTNKVYLAELLRSHQINTPDTFFINKHDTVYPSIAFPCVLKKPDSSFSHGVVKAENEKEFHKILKQFFKTSDLVLVQPFIPTEFDWRIGILDNKPIFACRYYMAEGHWQIYNWQSPAGLEGKNEPVSLSEIPENILKTALKSTKLIGDSLYGVDIKSCGDSHYVIEINDNPNIDFGLEDSIKGDFLYQEIMQVFLQRIRRKHGYG